MKMTVAKARKMLEDKGVTPIGGHAYNIYECGCVFDNTEDPNILAYFSESKLMNRSCPMHKPSALLIKYKKCNCGFENIGLRLQSSDGCKICAKATRRKSDGSRVKYQNAHSADPGRWACVHREECFKKYIKYEALPCKGCKDYQLGAGNVDPLDRTRKGVDF